MAITLKTLLKVAPFPEEHRQKIFANFDKLTEDQKTRLANTAWTAITQLYFARLKYERDKLLLQIQKGEKKYNPQDFKNIQEKLTDEWVEKLKAEGEEASIEEIRKELRAYSQAAESKKPSSQPTSSSQPPPSTPAEPTN